MKTRAAVAFTVLMAFSASGCERGPPSRPSGAEHVTMWRSLAAQNAREDVELTVTVQGTVATVNAKNLSEKPLCTSGTMWPDGKMMMGVFLVKAGGVYRLYDGPLASIVGDDSIRVLPGQTISGRVDISPYYDFPPGEAIESIEFSTSFYDCPAQGPAQ